ncbi:MAG: hypothetical protein KHY62_03360 [Firmicutes bacterium]|nr:hypothetical protein [Bacillota bacterium]
MNRKRIMTLCIAAVMILSAAAAYAVSMKDAENTVAGEITENTAEEKAKDSKAEEVTDECIKASEKVEKPRNTPQNMTVNKEAGEESESEEIREDNSSERDLAAEKAAKHIHSWEPVYSERQVEKTRQTAWTKCYKCGVDMTGNPSHIDQHLLNHETGVHYGTEYRTEIYYETERYIAGYSCACGASRK